MFNSNSQSNPNLALARRWFEEVWNKRRSETIDELLHRDSVCYGENGPICGVEEFKTRQFLPFTSCFKDLHVEIEDVIGDGDIVVVRWNFAGVRVGEQLGGKAGSERISFSGMTWIRFSEGQMIEGWQCSNIPKVVVDAELPSLRAMDVRAELPSVHSPKSSSSK